jgi:hypothetical protein
MPLLVKAGEDLQINVLGEEDLLSDYLFETANNANFEVVEIAERVLMKFFQSRRLHCYLRCRKL